MKWLVNIVYVSLYVYIYPQTELADWIYVSNQVLTTQLISMASLGYPHIIRFRTDTTSGSQASDSETGAPSGWSEGDVDPQT